MNGFAAGIGLVDNRLIRASTWDGQTIASGDFQQVILKHTYRGDTDLNGQVTQADYTNVTANMGRAGIWFTGDLNHDGLVTTDDFAEVTMNLGAGVTPPPSPNLVTTVASPEPVAATKVKKVARKVVASRKPLPKVRIRV
jgi:hypothetical protein